MKSMILIIVSAFSFSSAQAQTCKEGVHGTQILLAIQLGLESALNRGENAYENSLALNSFQHPLFCSYGKGTSGRTMQVSVDVEVTEYYDDGGEEKKTATCEMNLEDQESIGWVALHIICDALNVDKELL